MRRAGPRRDPIHPVTVRGPAAERLRISVCRTSSACHVCPNVIRSSGGCATGTGSAAPTTIARLAPRAPRRGARGRPPARAASRSRTASSRRESAWECRAPRSGVPALLDRAPTSVHAPRRVFSTTFYPVLAFAYSTVELINSYRIRLQSRTNSVQSDKTAGAAQQPLRRGPDEIARRPTVRHRQIHNPCTTLAAQRASSPLAPLSDPPPAIGMAIRLRIDARATSSPPPHPSLRCSDGRSARRPVQEITRHACPSAEL